MERSTLSLGTSGGKDYTPGAPIDPSPLSQSARQNTGRFNENFDAIRPSTAITEGTDAGANMHRSDSVMSQSNTLLPSRGGTLKKKQSLKRSSSLKRSGSRRSLSAGSVRSLALGEREKYADGHGDELYSAFFTPVPTSGNPTDILANRFQAWRKVLKDLLNYFREIQKSYESKSKSLLSAANVINNMDPPPMLLAEGGIGDATQLLRHYHKQALAEANKAKNIEEEVIVQLSGLRSDLQQKIKEIKNLSGDFKNSVDKETELTRKAVRELQEALGLIDTSPNATTGKGDPFIVRLNVDRQVEKQIDEENYLHRAFLNLENSGRELESIVVGEIQKAYNAYAGILKREADEAYEAVEALRSGPIAMPKDTEWNAFVHNNEHFVDPQMPIRRPSQIEYPGKNAPAAIEVRAGMLERKSKYLKSYSPGWYVLSPTHLHEFKSADRINYQSPVMSLYLPEQKLGSRSNADSSSHKFMLKGRQTGSMHRGHGWVFRAESQDTMLAWYEDIKNLTEKTGEERNAFVRRHARSMSAGSHKAGSISSDGAMDEDEADQTPYSATPSQLDQVSPQEPPPVRRPQPGGRFPSDLNVNRGLHVPLSPSSGASSDDYDAIAAAAAALPDSGILLPSSNEQVSKNDGDYGSRGIAGVRSDSYGKDEGLVSAQEERAYNENLFKRGASSDNFHQKDYSHEQGMQNVGVEQRSTHIETHGITEYDTQPVSSHSINSDEPGRVAYPHYSRQQSAQSTSRAVPSQTERPNTHYGEWMAPATAGAGGAAVGFAGAEAYQDLHLAQQSQPEEVQQSPSMTESKQLADHAITPNHHEPSLPVSDVPVAVNPIPTELADSSTIANAPVPKNVPASMEPLAADAPVPLAVSRTEGKETAAAPLEERPLMHSHQSEQTISDLHIPGEYPRGSRGSISSGPNGL